MKVNFWPCMWIVQLKSSLGKFPERQTLPAAILYDPDSADDIDDDDPDEDLDI